MRLVIEIDVGSEPMTGRVGDGTSVVTFTGLLELLPLLESARFGATLDALDARPIEK
jgi:hypothetical protein